MKLAVQIFSWIALILGALTLLGTFAAPTAEDAFYSFLGGLLFVLQGSLTLIYVRDK